MLVEQAALQSFVRRARQEFAALSATHAGDLVLGQGRAPRRLRLRCLSAGLSQVLSTTNGLSLADKLVIAEWLLPLDYDTTSVVVTPVAPPMALQLSFNSLAPRLRGSTTAPLLLSGTIGGTVPAGTLLLVLRDGQLLRRQAAVAGPYSLTDTEPGSHYEVQLSPAGLSRTQTRGLLSPVLSGVLAHGATNVQLVALPATYPGFTNGVGRFSFLAQRKRIFLAVPVELGEVVRFTQPNDQDADTTAAFSATVRQLDFGLDGLVSYRVYENNSDFIGPFTLDAHLAPPPVATI